MNPLICSSGANLSRNVDGEDEERGRHDQEDEADRNAIAFVEHAFEFEKYELVRLQHSEPQLVACADPLSSTR